MITVRTFGNFKRVNIDFEKPDGADHDQNTYCFRLVDGAMIFRGVALGTGWESRHMNWRGISCFIQKNREDDSMALITKESGRPEARADKYEIMAKAKEMMREGSTTVKEVSEKLGVPAGTLYTWIGKEKKLAEKAQAVLESVEPELQHNATEVAVEDNAQEPERCAHCNKSLAWEFYVRSAGEKYCNVCYHAIEKQKAYQRMGLINPAPIGVEVPNFEPGDEPILTVEPVGEKTQAEHLVDAFAAVKEGLKKVFPPDDSSLVLTESFDIDEFVVELIESVMELSQLRNAPASIRRQVIAALNGAV